ncbi:unnamed protein product [Coregonus sp. 'balchen']|nr:unnamed protein product [Coregonus sp. 'balchen']
MGGCLSKSKPVEVKVELTLLEKEKEADVMSPNGKASPFSECRPNGALGHCSDEDAAAAPLRLYKPRDYVEASVCHVKDMENGQMREVDLGSGRALLIKEHGEFSAIGHKCPHYGAPLVKGVLSKGHVRCPWHGACFNIATGDIEDFPGLDSLPTFQVRIEKDKVIIRANKQSQKRSKAMARCSAVINSSTGFSYILIVGSGPAGLVCAETLRQEGFTDRIVMCTMDKYPPYDRPKLSKPMNYKGQDVRNVFHLRTPEDANSVARLANNKNAVIVGTSFVGMEVAAALTDKAHSVSIIGIEAVPFRKALGEKVGKAIMKLFETNRVKFYMLNEVSEMVGHHGQLKEVVLKSGKVLRADVCVIGTGRVAALGMMGRPTEIKTVPYFWSAMFGKSLRYAGYGEGFDDVVIQGDVDELKFVAFYTRSEEVVAVASMNYDPIVSRVAEVLGSGKTIRKRDVE